MKKLLFLLSLVCLSCSPVEQNVFNGQWVDLTHDFSTETIYWPTARVFEKTTVFEGHTAAGFYYTAYDFCAAEHGGTYRRPDSLCQSSYGRAKSLSID
jgi:hypothetical protein